MTSPQLCIAPLVPLGGPGQAGRFPSATGSSLPFSELSANSHNGYLSEAEQQCKHAVVWNSDAAKCAARKLGLRNADVE
jgi:hypothetical protein